MLYAAKCYWPGVTESDLEQVGERAATAGLGIGRDGGRQGPERFAQVDMRRSIRMRRG
jgi:hypothetical protein